jgi:hypothetical protein
MHIQTPWIWSIHLFKQTKLSKDFSHHSVSLFPSLSLSLSPLIESKRPIKQKLMATSRLHLFFTHSLLFFCKMLSLAMAKPAYFARDFRVTWAGSHITELNNGSSLQLLLDRNSGLCFYVASLFQNYSQKRYMHFIYNMSIVFSPSKY